MVKRGLGGRGGLEGFFILRREFGAVALEVNVQRSLICERVKTGTRIVPAEPAKVIPPTEEREEEVFEWKCGEVLP